MLNDTFYNVFRYLDRFDTKYDLKPWLSKVCVNCCIRYLKKYPSPSFIVDLDQAQIGEQLTSDDEATLGDHYLKIIKELSPQYRTVFNLYVFEEYKHSEIAELLGISVGTSKSNLSRAKAYLAKRIEEHQEGKSKRLN